MQLLGRTATLVATPNEDDTMVQATKNAQTGDPAKDLIALLLAHAVT